jgi:hypothetical protein
MKKSSSRKPFGLLFEEKAPTRDIEISPQYDEDSDISYVEGQNGEIYPLVSLSHSIGTASITEVKTESTDTDPEEDNKNVNYLSTMTGTFIKAESTDTDPEDDNVALIGTKTQTRIKAESTDSDQDEETRLLKRISILATDTVTKEDNESNDRD